ncbi:ribosomal protein L15 [Leucogyrophana mollusca]|uniref:Ribosomal protein L15 n=1 Tax=Leucogyrophana mollusca TaxID=85980 RepID=A0ACB8BQ49_9AGAM|nr:ribosomal protein L15 [Leucogyrophana mollusca]
MSAMASMMRTRASRITLSNLSPNPKSQHAQKRLGRGQGSGKGGTSGRGHKGQKARSGNGKPKAGFEGGQTPITKRFPKRGFVNPNRKEYAPVNLDRIQHWIEQGRLHSSPENPITARELVLSGCVHDVHDGIKLLGDGAAFLKTPVHITPSKASKSAIKAVEASGGSVFCKYYNPLALRDCVKSRTDRVSAAPTRRTDIRKITPIYPLWSFIDATLNSAVWYTDWKNRGYLSPEAIGKMPIVEERWKELSKQLLAFKDQTFDTKKIKKA